MLVKATEVDLMDGLNGGCISCGEISYGTCEPDAREYPCDNCGLNTVYGLEELAIMGQLEIIDESEE